MPFIHLHEKAALELYRLGYVIVFLRRLASNIFLIFDFTVSVTVVRSSQLCTTF